MQLELTIYKSVVNLNSIGFHTATPQSKHINLLHKSLPRKKS